MNDTIKGQVIGCFARRFKVAAAEQTLDCVSKGKRKNISCGDAVQVRQTGANEGVIEAVLPRQNLLFRQDQAKTKAIAANVTQVWVVVAGTPPCHPALLQRCLLAAEAASAASRILLNKIDLPESGTLAEQLHYLSTLGYPMTCISAKRTVDALQLLLSGETTVLIGQSGVGKSTLVNALLPEAQARVGELSTALKGGKHTTTSTFLYRLNSDTFLIDSPGMQNFGLQHLAIPELAACFPDFRRWLGRCRFHNCQHLNEPQCALSIALSLGHILPQRMALYRSLVAEKGRAEGQRG